MKCDTGLLPSSIMASKPIEFHKDAASEYEIAVDWYFERSNVAAQKFADETNRAIASVAKNPQRWPAYREQPSVIQILAIAHGHRQPDYWKRRL